MRLFSERAGLSPSYIYDIERGTTVPSPAKLDAITSVLREVADEQGADPNADARELFRARELTVYVDRLQIDPKLADIFVALRELDDDALANGAEPILRVLEFFSHLDQPAQRGTSRFIVDAMSGFDTLSEADRNDLGMQIAQGIIDIVEVFEKNHEKPDRTKHDREGVEQPSTI
jgi:transcriptional regulator with XRE-family HTH domain